MQYFFHNVYCPRRHFGEMKQSDFEFIADFFQFSSNSFQKKQYAILGRRIFFLCAVFNPAASFVRSHFWLDSTRQFKFKYFFLSR
jgi:hypothetical protein